jgi:tetratricopeptide (TPR) repeat protein
VTEEEAIKLGDEAMECHVARRYERELELWQRMAEHEPDHPMWKHNVALALMNNGRFVEALEIFDELTINHPDLSRVHNNRAVLLLRLGFEPKYLTPAFYAALETSKDFGEFTRHFHNFCFAIAWGTDKRATDALDALDDMLPKALATFLPKDSIESHVLVFKKGITGFRNLAAYREAFAGKHWGVAEREIESAKQIFKELGQVDFKLEWASKCLSLCRDTIGTLERLSSDQTLTPDRVLEKFKSLFQEVHAFRTAYPNDAMTRLIDVLGWFLAGCKEAFRYLSDPSKPYHADDEPQNMIHQLTSESFTEIGQNLASFVQFVHKQCVFLSQSAQTIASQDQVLAQRNEVWRRIALFSSGLHFNFSNVDATLANQMLGWQTDAVDEAKLEIQKFKLFIERQAFKDVFVDGNPQENIARALLQAFLLPRSYREVKVRGGQSDLLSFSKDGKFLYETKIWRGNEYYQQGLRELEEYIIGEGDDPDLKAIFYLVFDPTKAASAHNHIGGVMAVETVAGREVNVIVVNLAPPQPSKKI